MNNNYDYNNYNDYNAKEEANNENKSEDISLYNDGEDKKPKLVIIIASIIGALILILIFAFACTKLNKKKEIFVKFYICVQIIHNNSKVLIFHLFL